MSESTITGRKDIGNHHDEAMKVLASRMNTTYESKKQSVPSGSVNYAWKANVAGAFVKVPQAHVFVLRTDADITIRLNSATDDPIEVSSGEGSFTYDGVEITNFFISVPGGSAATIRIVMS